MQCSDVNTVQDSASNALQCIAVQCMSSRNSVDCLQGIIQRTALWYSYNTVQCWVQGGYRVSQSIPPLQSLECSALYSVYCTIHSAQFIECSVHPSLHYTAKAAVTDLHNSITFLLTHNANLPCHVIPTVTQPPLSCYT